MTDRKKRLELTWIGKEERPRLEPRILLEDTALSHHAVSGAQDPLFSDCFPTAWPGEGGLADPCLASGRSCRSGPATE